MSHKLSFVSDFNELRESQGYFVDKSHLISETMESGHQVLILPRPRRFGKTVNLSMLYYFFEKSEEDRLKLFDGLSVSKDVETMQHFNKYPVIFLTFKDTKQSSFEGAIKKISGACAKEMKRLQSKLPKNLTPYDKAFVEKVINCECELEELEEFLGKLSGWLSESFGQKVIILVESEIYIN